MFSTKIPRPVPSLESRISRAITASDELAELAAEALSADRLNFSEAQYELLLNALENMGAARQAMEMALAEQWYKASARAEILRKILDRGV